MMTADPKKVASRGKIRFLMGGQKKVNPMKYVGRRLLALAVCGMAFSQARASLIADWTFPATGTATAPINATSAQGTTGTPTINGTIFTTIAAHGGTATYVTSGASDVLQFSYAGNHASDINGATLTLTLTASTTLTFSSLNYSTLFTGSPATQTWTYSISGGGSGNIGAVSVGNTLTSESLSFGATLNAGQTITITDTITGASGNNQSLDFGEIQLLGTPVPEPVTYALSAFGLMLAGWTVGRRFLSRFRCAA